MHHAEHVPPWPAALTCLLSLVLVAGCTAPPEATDAEATLASWPFASFDTDGTRAVSAEDGIAPTDVTDLGLEWAFVTKGAPTGTPTVKDGRLYAATWAGMVYALDPDTGDELWRYDNGDQVDASVTAWDDLVFFGDNNGTLHALDAATGDPAWSVKVDDMNSTHLYATPVVAETPRGAVLFMAVGSDQESIRLHGDKPLDFRGNVVAYDPRSGEELWRTYLVPEGHTGASVWGTPVYSSQFDLLYFGTANAYTEPAGNMTDAIVALEAATGEVAWHFQATKDDVFTQANPVSPDNGFGSTPALFTDAEGRPLVVLAAKSSVAWAFHAQEGSEAWHNGKVVQGEGVIADTSYADGVVALGYASQDKVRGMNATTGETLWDTPMDGGVYSDPAISGDVVFAADTAGTIRALGLHDGQTRWETTTGDHGAVFGGLSVINGHLYVPTLSDGFLGPEGAILAYTPGGAAGDATEKDDEAADVVELKNLRFEPDTLEVEAGTTVTWVSKEPIFHTVTSGWDDGATFDFDVNEGERVQWTFDEPGTYEVFCRPHASQADDGTWQGMAQTITVTGP